MAAEPMRGARPAAKADEAAAQAQLEAISELFADFSGSGNMVLVTHGENIQALTGAAPREGEAVIVRPDGEKRPVLGRIIFN